MYLSRGQRIKLSDLSNSNKFTIKVSAEDNKNGLYDISCFGLDEQDKCSDDRYMIFYNQRKSPCTSITLLETTKNNSEEFIIDLSKIPQSIKKLVFTITLDDIGTMSQLIDGSFLLFENGTLKGGFKLKGTDFTQEKSIIICEIYIKNEWRISAVGHGFNGGLSALLAHFGIEEETNEQQNIYNPVSQIDYNTQNNLSQQNTPTNKITSFIKGIFSSPFKYAEKKSNERAEHNEKLQNQIKFQELLREYLSDGILTKSEMNSLETFCKEKNLSLQECLKNSNHDIENFLHGMLADIVSDNIISKEEEETINSVCHFLNPSQNIRREIDETLKRVRSIENIKSGNVNTITHNLVTKLTELVWHSQTNVNLIREVRKEMKYYPGEMFVTSERIIFKSYDNPVEIHLKNINEVEVDGTNFYIVGKNNRSTFQFILHEGEILEAYIQQALNKFHRKLNLSQTANRTRVIPQSVKHAVWLRDGGQCVQCRAEQYLEFDHIIPYSRGGSNSESNIQILCRRCNLSKSNKL